MMDEQRKATNEDLSIVYRRHVSSCPCSIPTTRSRLKADALECFSWLPLNQQTDGRQRGHRECYRRVYEAVSLFLAERRSPADGRSIIVPR